MRKRMGKLKTILKNLSWSAKLGFVLWIIGYPISWIGGLLFFSGHRFWGTILFFVPFIEGNLGIILMGKQGFKAIKQALKGKK